MGLTMLVYSSLLLAVLVGGAPWWLIRMASSGRYRAGLAGRLGKIPSSLREACPGRQVIWLHAVSVGEVLAATRLVAELQAAMPGVVVAVSTTTETGQRLARERFQGAPVFYLPLDFAVLMRRYLRVLRPRLVVLMESELWPNMIRECSRMWGAHRGGERPGVGPVVPRATCGCEGSGHRCCGRSPCFLRKARRRSSGLRAMGVAAERVVVAGNLKYDVRAPQVSEIAGLVREVAAGRPVVVAGSTLGGRGNQEPDEEHMAIQAWEGRLRREKRVLLVIAPRHPDRFDLVYSVAVEFPTLRATEMLKGKHSHDGYSVLQRTGKTELVEVVVLDTIGDLASVYGVADVAFVGGSLVAKGGHNPLEPAQFGVPVVMGRSYENFREVVEAMRAADGICLVADKDELETTLITLLMDPAQAAALGARGRSVFEAQAGATTRTVRLLLGLLR